MLIFIYFYRSNYSRDVRDGGKIAAEIKIEKEIRKKLTEKKQRDERKTIVTLPEKLTLVLFKPKIKYEVSYSGNCSMYLRNY